MSMLKQFVNRTEFASYEDFRDHLEIRVPENFNFAYDVVDAYAAREPARRAMVWCNDEGAEKIVTFADLKAGSDCAAQVFAKLGIRKGDAVLMIMKGRLEFWHALLGLHKLGAIGVPATHMLTEHDWNTVSSGRASAWCSRCPMRRWKRRSTSPRRRRRARRS
jgi:acetyl-CoA synthetase